MLQDIRKSSQGTAAKIIIGLIVISFAGFGLQSILVDGGGGSVGEVNGETITPNEFNLAMNTQQRRLISMMGENFDPTMLEPDKLKPQVLESIVTRKLLIQSAAEHGLSVSESEIGALIGGMEQFQLDGQFSPEAYRAALANAGYEPAYFKQNLKEDLVINQLRSGLAGSEFVTPAEMGLNARIALEQRDIRYLTLPRENFQSSEPIDQGAIEAYYANNQLQFQTEEALDVDYIELVAEDFVQPVNEQLVREAYDEEVKAAQYGTQNRVSHILLTDDVDEKLANINAKLTEGVAFADVAKEFSDDAGSANLGGDLGFTTGDSFPEEMEAALALLDIQQVSEPVVTDAGTHLLLVTERTEAEPPSFEELRAGLESRIALEEAKVEIVRVVDTLKDLAFNADDLDDPAAELDLEVEKSQGITRTLTEGLFSRPALRSLAFSEEILEQGHNSDVIEIGDNHYVALRVREHHRPEVLPIEEVQSQIEIAIRDTQTTAALNQEALQLLAAVRAGGSIETLALEKGYEWQVELGLSRRASNLSPGVMQRVFEMSAPEAEQAVADVVTVETGDTVLVELVGVNAGDYQLLTDEQQTQLKRAVTSEFSALLDTQYMRGLRDGAEINVL